MSDQSFKQKIADIIGSGIMFGAAIVFLAPIATALGAISGWTTGIIFGGAILPVLSKLGLQGVEFWQLGAFLGFLSPFMRTKTTVVNK